LNFHKQNTLSHITNYFRLFIFTVQCDNADENMILLYKPYRFRTTKWKISHLVPIQHCFWDHCFSWGHFNFNVLKNMKVATWSVTTLKKITIISFSRFYQVVFDYNWCPALLVIKWATFIVFPTRLNSRLNIFCLYYEPCYPELFTHIVFLLENYYVQVGRNRDRWYPCLGKFGVGKQKQ